MILVSPFYRQVVGSSSSSANGRVVHPPSSSQGKSSSGSPLDAARNAARIYERIISDLNSNSNRRRFVIIMMPGSSEVDIPQSLLRSGLPVYNWPTEYLNLFYCMLRPSEMVSQFVRSRDLQRVTKNS